MDNITVKVGSSGRTAGACRCLQYCWLPSKLVRIDDHSMLSGPSFRNDTEVLQDKPQSVDPTTIDNGSCYTYTYPQAALPIHSPKLLNPEIPDIGHRIPVSMQHHLVQTNGDKACGSGKIDTFLHGRWKNLTTAREHFYLQATVDLEASAQKPSPSNPLSLMFSSGQIPQKTWVMTRRSFALGLRKRRH